MSEFLDAFEQEIKRCEGANVFAIAEYHNGALSHKQLQRTNPCQNVYSIAKTYIVTAIGLLVDRGLLSTDEILTDILADELPEGFHPIWKRTTVEMLLLHKVGLAPNFLDIDCNDATAFGEDFLAYTLNAPITEGFDGSTSTYTDAAYYLLSRIVEKRAGMPTDSFLWEHLLYPTGCREAAWSRCPMGHVIGATGLYIRAKDVAKHGAIYLNGGTYEGKRILSERFVHTVLEKGYELKCRQYPGVYSKGGMRGQGLVLIPAQGRAVAYLGCGDNPFTHFVATWEK